MYCAGKNHVAAMLEAQGLPVLDVDKLGYHVLETEKETIFTQFGEDLKKTDGTLDRRLLGQLVFRNPAKLAALETIVHPRVNRLTDEWIEERNKVGNRNCVVNAALLHRSVIFNKLDRIILVKASFLTRLIRAKRRDRLSLPAIIKRFASQKNFNSQYLSSNAEIYKVENPGLSGSRKQLEKLERRVKELIKGIF